MGIGKDSGIGSDIDNDIETLTLNISARIKGIHLRAIERRKIYPVSERVYDQILVTVPVPSPVLSAFADGLIEELPAGMVGRAILEADDVGVRGRAVAGRRRGFPLSIANDLAQFFLAFRLERLRYEYLAHLPPNNSRDRV